MKPKPILCALLCFLSTQLLFSQDAVVPSGGEGQGSGGTISYTVGQVFYHYYPGDEANITEGVQQAYEISVITGSDQDAYQLHLSAFPNPVADRLVLESAAPDHVPLQWSMYSLSGQILDQGILEGKRVEINTQHLSASTYFIHISQDDQTVQSFKIIKKTY